MKTEKRLSSKRSIASLAIGLTLTSLTIGSVAFAAAGGNGNGLANGLKKLLTFAATTGQIGLSLVGGNQLTPTVKGAAGGPPQQASNLADLTVLDITGATVTAPTTNGVGNGNGNSNGAINANPVAAVAQPSPTAGSPSSSPSPIKTFGAQTMSAQTCEEALKGKPFIPKSKGLPGAGYTRLTQLSTSQGNLIAEGDSHSGMKISKVELVEADDPGNMPAVGEDDHIYGSVGNTPVKWRKRKVHLRVAAHDDDDSNASRDSRSDDISMKVYIDDNDVIQSCTPPALTTTVSCNGVPVTGDKVTCDAICPGGSTVLSGGCAASHPDWKVVYSAPAPLAGATSAMETANGWRCTIEKVASSANNSAAVGFSVCQN